jgi:hypothetical protein
LYRASTFFARLAIKFVDGQDKPGHDGAKEQNRETPPWDYSMARLR